jgi:hypothetical protein
MIDIIFISIIAVKYNIANQQRTTTYISNRETTYEKPYSHYQYRRYL